MFKSVNYLKQWMLFFVGSKACTSAAFLLVAASPVFAQSAPLDLERIISRGKIPKDLTLTITTRGGGPFSTTTTNNVRADGKVYFSSYGGLPTSSRSSQLIDLSIDGKKTPKPKLKDKI